MLDRNDVATGHPTWNSYMRQLKKYKDAHGDEAPDQREIYEACCKDEPRNYFIPIYFVCGEEDDAYELCKQYKAALEATAGREA